MVTSNSVSSSARYNGVDRFYCPPALRRQLEQQQQLQKQQENRQKKSSRVKLRPPPAAKSPPIDDHRVDSDGSSSNSNSNSFNPVNPTPSVAVGNLDRFLDSTTPVVLRRKASSRRWTGMENAQSCMYYDLGDLWDCYNEWSSYGNGVPLVLNGEDEVVQYYVPYLSGIQLFVDSLRHSSRSRQQHIEKNDDVTYQDTCTEFSNTSNGHADQEGSLNEENESPTQAIRPIFEYMARDSPYGRVPLSEKIKELTAKFPGLKTCRSCDLHPSSWMCVAWYPIYRIPTGQTLKDLDACFLTFHLLSAPTSNLSNGHSMCNGSSSRMSQISTKLSVPVFGLASYKLKGSIWTSNGPHEQQQADSLLQAADDWIRRLNVDHPDFQFFVSRYNTKWRKTDLGFVLIWKI